MNATNVWQGIKRYKIKLVNVCLPGNKMAKKKKKYERPKIIKMKG